MLCQNDIVHLCTLNHTSCHFDCPHKVSRKMLTLSQVLANASARMMKDADTMYCSP